MIPGSLNDFERKIKRIIIPEDELRSAVKEAGKKLSSLYDGRPLLLTGILNGSFVFMADLCREINVPCEVGFISAKSYYCGTESSGKVTITSDLKQDVSKYHLIIVEDIVDTGRTLKEVVKIMSQRYPASLTVITLLDKPDRRVVEFTPDISLFTIPDVFVIGYGLDCGEYYRNLPYIAEFDNSGQ